MKKFFYAVLLLCILFALGPLRSERFYHPIISQTDAVWIDSESKTGTFEALVTAIGATPTTLKINVAESIVADTTIPSTLSLKFTPNGSISVAATKNFDIQTTNIDAGNYQIFAGDGDVDFADGTIVRSSWFTTFEKGLTLIGASDKVIYTVTEDHTITTTDEVTSNINLSFFPGHVLSDDANNATLTISNSVFASKDQQIFDWGNGTGNVLWYEGAQYWVGWYGAVGDGSADDTAEIQEALDSVRDRETLFFEGGRTYITSSSLDFYNTYGLTGIRIGGFKNRAIIRNTTQTSGNVLYIGSDVKIEYSRFENLEFYADDLTGTIVFIDGAFFSENIMDNITILGGDASKNGSTKTQGICLTHTSAGDLGSYKNTFSRFRVEEVKWGISVGYDGITGTEPANIVTNLYIVDLKTYYIGASNLGHSVYYGYAGNCNIERIETYTGRGTSDNRALSDIFLGANAGNIEGRKLTLNSNADYGIYITATATGTDMQYHLVGSYDVADVFDGNAGDATYQDGQTLQDLNTFSKWSLEAYRIGPMSTFTFFYLGDAPNGTGAKISDNGGFETTKTTKVKVYNSTVQTIAGSGASTVEYNTEVWDVLDEFDLATETFTPTYEGSYRLTAKGDFGNVAAKNYLIEIRLDGVVAQRIAVSPASAYSGGTYFIQDVFYLTSDDDMTVYFRNDEDATNTDLSAATATFHRNYFLIERVLLGN